MAAVLTDSDPQSEVTSYFEDDARFWLEIYSRRDVFARIYQHRLDAAMAWVDQLAMPAGTRVLDLGCGAGLTAVALAQRGFLVTGLDSADAMLKIARRAAIEAGVKDRIKLGTADAHHLTQPNGSFRLVIALGLVPWLHTPSQAISEIARVLSLDGYLIVSADNRWRLTYLFDPLYTPLLTLPRRMANKTLGRKASVGPRARMTSCADLDSMLASAGFRRAGRRSIGFGPFTLFGRRILSEPAGVHVQEALQRWADAAVPGLRLGGTQYMVLAAK